MTVFIGNGKTTCFGLQRPSSGFDSFLAIRVIYNMHKPRGDLNIATRFMNIHRCSLHNREMIIIYFSFNCITILKYLVLTAIFFFVITLLCVYMAFCQRHFVQFMKQLSIYISVLIITFLYLCINHYIPVSLY